MNFVISFHPVKIKFISVEKEKTLCLRQWQSFMELNDHIYTITGKANKNARSSEKNLSLNSTVRRILLT